MHPCKTSHQCHTVTPYSNRSQLARRTYRQILCCLLHKFLCFEGMRRQNRLASDEVGRTLLLATHGLSISHLALHGWQRISWVYIRDLEKKLVLCEGTMLGDCDGAILKEGFDTLRLDSGMLIFMCRMGDILRAMIAIQSWTIGRLLRRHYTSEGDTLSF